MQVRGSDAEAAERLFARREELVALQEALYAEWEALPKQPQ